MVIDINKYTQKSQEALQVAQSIAVKHGNQDVEPEHILLALLQQEEDLVPRLLNSINIPFESVKNKT